MTGLRSGNFSIYYILFNVKWGHERAFKGEISRVKLYRHHPLTFYSSHSFGLSEILKNRLVLFLSYSSSMSVFCGVLWACFVAG
jgi:hypothetical protein